MVVEHNGILQVSAHLRNLGSDSNHAVVRFEQAFHPAENPSLHFPVELTDTPATPTRSLRLRLLASIAEAKCPFTATLSQHHERA